MKILVVTAHPQATSLCHTIAAYIVQNLKLFGHELVIQDLYSTNFDPVLTGKERSRYYQNALEVSDIKSEMDHLKTAEALVLVFPTWWFGFPGILKGWFDRVWAPSVAFDHAGDLGAIKPKLNNLKNTFVVTTLGAPWWVDYFILWRPVKRIIRYALLGACTRKCRFKYLSFYKCEKVNEERIIAMKSKIKYEITKMFER